MTDFAGSRTVEEVLNTDRNIETINAMVRQYKISLEDAKKVYITWIKNYSKIIGLRFIK